jgi:hypothetical protein
MPAWMRVRKNTAPLIKSASLRQSPDHGCEHSKSTNDCGARFCSRLGVGRRGSPPCARFSCNPLPGHRIRGAVLFGLGIPQGLASASVECRVDGATRPADLAGNKCRRVDPQAGIHHRCARIPTLRAGHNHVFRGEFPAAAAGSRHAAIVAATGIETASIVFALRHKAVLSPTV